MKIELKPRINIGANGVIVNYLHHPHSEQLRRALKSVPTDDKVIAQVLQVMGERGFIVCKKVI